MLEGGICAPTVRVSAHGEVQHGVAKLVLRLLLQLLTQTLQGSFVLNNTNSSQWQPVSDCEDVNGPAVVMLSYFPSHTNVSFLWRILNRVIDPTNTLLTFFF